MKTPQVMAMVTIATILAMVIGCATIGSPTPEEEVAAALADFQAAIKAQDLEKIIGSYPNDFTDSQGVNKSIVRSLFESMATQGTLKKESDGVWRLVSSEQINQKQTSTTALSVEDIVYSILVSSVKRSGLRSTLKFRE